MKEFNSECVSVLKDQVEELKVQIGEITLEKNFYKSRLRTIERTLLKNRDVFEHDSELFDDLVRLTRTIV